MNSAEIGLKCFQFFIRVSAKIIFYQNREKERTRREKNRKRERYEEREKEKERERRKREKERLFSPDLVFVPDFIGPKIGSNFQ